MSFIHLFLVWILDLDFTLNRMPLNWTFTVIADPRVSYRVHNILLITRVKGIRSLTQFWKATNIDIGTHVSFSISGPVHSWIFILNLYKPTSLQEAGPSRLCLQTLAAGPAKRPPVVPSSKLKTPTALLLSNWKSQMWRKKRKCPTTPTRCDHHHSLFVKFRRFFGLRHLAQTKF